MKHTQKSFKWSNDRKAFWIFVGSNFFYPRQYFFWSEIPFSHAIVASEELNIEGRIPKSAHRHLLPTVGRRDLLQHPKHGARCTLPKLRHGEPRVVGWHASWVAFFFCCGFLDLLMNETFSNKSLWTSIEMTPLTSEKGSLGKWLVTLCMGVAGEQEALFWRAWRI